VRPNGKLLLAIAASAVLQLIVFLTPLGKPLDVVPVDTMGALLAAALPALAVLLAVDLHKLAFHHIAKRRSHTTLSA
jgi:hypothetical protein